MRIVSPPRSTLFPPQHAAPGSKMCSRCISSRLVGPVAALELTNVALPPTICVALGKLLSSRGGLSFLQNQNNRNFFIKLQKNEMKMYLKSLMSGTEQACSKW